MCDFFCKLDEVEDERDEFEQKVNILTSQKKILIDDQKRINCTDSEVDPCSNDKILDRNARTYRNAVADVCCVPKATCSTMTDNACGSPGKINDPTKNNETCAGKTCDDSDIATCCRNNPASSSGSSGSGSTTGGGSGSTTGGGSGSTTGGGSGSTTGGGGVTTQAPCSSSAAAPLGCGAPKVIDSTKMCESSPCATTDKTTCCVTPPRCSPGMSPAMCSPDYFNVVNKDSYCPNMSCSGTPSRDVCCTPSPSYTGQVLGSGFTGSMYPKRIKGKTCFRYFFSLFIILLTFIILRLVSRKIYFR